MAVLAAHSNIRTKNQERRRGGGGKTMDIAIKSGSYNRNKCFAVAFFHVCAAGGCSFFSGFRRVETRTLAPRRRHHNNKIYFLVWRRESEWAANGRTDVRKAQAIASSQTEISACACIQGRRPPERKYLDKLLFAVAARSKKQKKHRRLFYAGYGSTTMFGVLYCSL